MNPVNLFRLLLLGSLISFVSCTKFEDEPHTHPKLGIASILTIDPGGATFAAEIYEMGADPIIEHGFVYNRQGNPSLSNSDVIRISGSPGMSFSEKATYSLNKGVDYAVAAYLKTEKSVIYSKPMTFTSQGSEGIQFGELILPEFVFYGDTLFLSAKNISINKENHRDWSIMVDQNQTLITEVTESGIYFLLPELPYLNRTGETEVSFEFQFNFDDSKLKLEKQAKFREPEFWMDTPVLVKPGNAIPIRGKYLQSAGTEVIYRHPVYGYQAMYPTFVDGTLFFSPTLSIREQNPKFQIQIRGKNYDLDNLVEFIPSEITPGQVIEMKLNNEFNIIGENFFPGQYVDNIFEIDNSGILLGTNSSTSTRVSAYVSQPQTYLRREIKVYAKNFGIRSQNYALLKITDPLMYYAPLHPDLNYTWGREWINRKSYQGKGYEFRGQRIYLTDPETRTSRLLATIPLTEAFYSGTDFSDMDQEGNFIFGVGNFSSTLSQFTEIFAYSVNSNSVGKLATPIDNAMLPISVFSDGKFVYFMGAKDSKTWQPLPDMKLNRTTGQWTYLPNTSNPDRYEEVFQHFRYQGEVYAVANPYQDGYDEIFKFNRASEAWELHKTIPKLSRIRGSEIMVIGEWAYIFTELGFKKLNLETYETVDVPLGMHGHFLNFHFNGEKIYFSSSDATYELDLSYLD